MDPTRELSVIFGMSTQSVVDQIKRDAAAPAFEPMGRIPSRTTACKGYVQMVRKQQQHQRQKKPFKRIPRFIEK